MFMKISLFSFFALRAASSSRSCHATGVVAWARIYGLELWAARFWRGGRSEMEALENWADSSASRLDEAAGF
jgi:hypothetical protein